jgi:hypothetical protein
MFFQITEKSFENISPLKSFPNPCDSNIYLGEAGAYLPVVDFLCSFGGKKNVYAWDSMFGGIGCARCAGLRICRVKGELG